jgi:serine/threonine protein kinase
MIQGRKRDAFLREVSFLRECRHPRIVLYMGTMELDQSLYIITEYLEQGSLKDLLKSNKYELNWALILRMATDISQGSSIHSLDVY